MKKSIFIICLLALFLQTLTAQVTFIIDSIPDYTPPDDIFYIAGDFQGWNPGNPDYALQKNNEERWFIVLDSMANGTTILFKFTRGDWGRVEKGIYGEEIPNREFIYGNGDTVGIIIYNWADNGSGNSTAAENVFVINEEFYIPQLDRYRRICIYLPPDYEESEDFYPVIYMHDGQNLFDTYTSFAGEWEVDETLNNIYNEGNAVPIVVGIDNGGTERINEYTPWTNPQYGGGQGALYIDFIVETLKPFIDENYRTLPGRKTTALWGSSLGGLITHYGVLKFQNIFSIAGIYSPSYWFSDSVWTFTQEMGHQQDMKLYQMTGSLEGSSTVTGTWAMHDTLSNMGFGEEELSTKIIEGGEHNEQLWRQNFAEAYLWLFHSFANNIKPNKFVENLTLFPNPVKDRLYLPDCKKSTNDSVIVYDIAGGCVKKMTPFNGEFIDVSSLEPGTYIIELKTKKYSYQGKFIKK